MIPNNDGCNLLTGKSTNPFEKNNVGQLLTVKTAAKGNVGHLLTVKTAVNTMLYIYIIIYIFFYNIPKPLKIPIFINFFYFKILVYVNYPFISIV